MQRRMQLRRCFIVVLMILSLFSVESVTGCASKEDEMTELSEVSDSSGEESGSLEKEQSGNDREGVELPEEPETIFVHVCGEVYRPGVYELPAGSRIYEALEAAGGLTEAAAFAYLNQAEKVMDGQQVYVPSVEEAAGAGVQEDMSGTVQADDGKINLNTASKEELMTLSGIGEVKAEAIIRYREDKGGFTSIEELTEIEGIKEGVFNKVKDQVKI